MSIGTPPMAISCPYARQDISSAGSYVLMSPDVSRGSSNSCKQIKIGIVFDFNVIGIPVDEVRIEGSSRNVPNMSSGCNDLSSCFARGDVATNDSEREGKTDHGDA